MSEARGKGGDLPGATAGDKSRSRSGADDSDSPPRTPDTSPEELLAARAALFKALGHPARLLIVNLIRRKPRHGEELAAILQLSPATISHHLKLLAEAGLLTSGRSQYTRDYRMKPRILNRRLHELVDLGSDSVDAHTHPDAFHRKVLNTFFERGRLTRIPAQRKKRRVVLERLVEEFEPEHDYPEAAVNSILAEFHPDVATLRRELVGEGLVTRNRAIYRRVIGGQSLTAQDF